MVVFVKAVCDKTIKFKRMIYTKRWASDEWTKNEELN